MVGRPMDHGSVPHQMMQNGDGCGVGRERWRDRSDLTPEVEGPHAHGLTPILFRRENKGICTQFSFSLIKVRPKGGIASLYGKANTLELIWTIQTLLTVRIKTSKLKRHKPFKNTTLNKIQ